MIKVTIMIPTYNQEKYILEAITSALNQTYTMLEIIVCDDYSTDGTFDLISQIKHEKLKVFQNEKNLGRVANYRNILYNLAQGDYVINLDGDDYFLDNNYIKNAVTLIEKEKVDLVFSNQIIKYPDHEKKTSMKLPKVLDGNWLFVNYGKNKLHIPHMTALYNKQKAIQLDFYSKDIISSDWESLLHFIIGKKVGFLETCSGVWQQIDNSESKVQNIDKVLHNINILANVSEYGKKYFALQDIKRWRYRTISSFIKNITTINIACNFLTIVNFGYKMLPTYDFVKLFVNYRFIGKLVIGKLKYKCVE